MIVQHIGASFAAALAARLDSHCAAKVALAQHDQFLETGHVYLAPGGSHLTIHSARRPYCRLVEADPVSGHKPSVDILFGSVARIVGGKAVGAILTGMGMDGARRSEEHTSELQSLMRISSAVFCLKKKINKQTTSK